MKRKSTGSNNHFTAWGSASGSSSDVRPLAVQPAVQSIQDASASGGTQSPAVEDASINGSSVRPHAGSGISQRATRAPTPATSLAQSSAPPHKQWPLRRAHSSIAQLAATASRPSTQTSPLASFVLSQFPSHLAILLREPAVLWLCQDQDRTEAAYEQRFHFYHHLYAWTRDIDVAMSLNLVPRHHAPPSAFILGQYALRFEAVFLGEGREACKESKPLYMTRIFDMFVSLHEGLQAFSTEMLQGNYNIEWQIYYEHNFNRVRNAVRFWFSYQRGGLAGESDSDVTPLAVRQPHDKM